MSVGEYKAIITNRNRTVRTTIVNESNNGCIGEFTIDVAADKNSNPIQSIEVHFGCDRIIDRLIDKYGSYLQDIAYRMKYGYLSINTNDCFVVSYKKATDVDFEELVISLKL